MSAIEVDLAVRLRLARTRFDNAKKEVGLASALMHDLGGAGTDDSTFSMLKASQEYSSSLTEYNDALRRFSAFVLHGRIPLD